MKKMRSLLLVFGICIVVGTMACTGPSPTPQASCSTAADCIEPTDPCVAVSCEQVYYPSAATFVGTCVYNTVEECGSVPDVTEDTFEPDVPTPKDEGNDIQPNEVDVTEPEVTEDVTTDGEIIEDPCDGLSDGTLCQGPDQCFNWSCQAGICVAGDPIICEPQTTEPCMDTVCDASAGCIVAPRPDGTTCELDSNACTADICVEGSCQHVARAGVLADETAVLFSSIIRAPDGGFFLAGYQTGADFNYDVIIQRTNPVGEVIWQNVYGGEEMDQAHSIVDLGTGVYVIAGDTRSQGAGLKDAWVFAIDENGEILWERVDGDNHNDSAFDVVPLPTGGVAVVGETRIPGGGVIKSDGWLMFLGTDGLPTTDDVTFGSPDGNDVLKAVKVMENGNLAMVGTRDDSLWLLVTDSAGNVQNESVFSSPVEGETRGEDLLVSGSDRVVLSGRAGSSGWVFETQVGTTDRDWDYLTGGTDQGLLTSLAVMPSGGYAVGGYLQAVTNSKNGLLSRLNIAGNIQWEQQLDEGFHDEIHDVVAIGEGGIAVAGRFGDGLAGWAIFDANGQRCELPIPSSEDP